MIGIRQSDVVKCKFGNIDKSHVQFTFNNRNILLRYIIECKNQYIDYASNMSKRYIMLNLEDFYIIPNIQVPVLQIPFNALHYIKRHTTANGKITAYLILQFNSRQLLLDYITIAEDLQLAGTLLCRNNEMFVHEEYVSIIGLERQV